MAARFIMLAFAALSLAACETATTEDTPVRRGASPTLGNVHRGQIRGPVVADAEVVPVPARHAGAVQRSSPRSGKRTASVIPNPMRARRSNTMSSATSAPAEGQVTAPVTSNLPTEPVQPASITDLPVAPAAGGEGQTTGAHPAAIPVHQPLQTSAPIDFGLGDLTPDKIEAIFGGMPFLLIASIAAALFAALGLALRRSPSTKRDEDYEGPHLVENEDHREPYAA